MVSYKEIIQIMFLCMSWEDRQQLKRMLSDSHVAVLAECIECSVEEINW